MGNQISALSFGVDATTLIAYAQSANERLGPIDFNIENTGDIDLYFQVRQYDGTTSPSGWANVGGNQTVKARGSKTLSYNLLSKRVGFFGSGVAATITNPSGATGLVGQSVYKTSTTANIEANIRNKGDLRGAQIDIVAVGRQGYGYDQGFPKAELKKKWGSLNTGNGAIDPTADGV